MNKEISKFFKFKTVDRAILKQAIDPDSISILVCNIWTPNDSSKDSYLWIATPNAEIFDKIETNLSAFEVQLEEVYHIQKDFLNYSLIHSIFLDE